MIILPGIEKFNSRKDWESNVWQSIVRRISEINSSQATDKALRGLLTVKEKQQITKRVAVASLLKQGKKYSEISEILWLSPNTISMIKKNLEEKENGYLSQYGRNKDRKIREKSSVSKSGNRSYFSGYGPNVIAPHGKLFFPQRRKR